MENTALNKNFGFTLIELLITIAVFSVLATAVIMLINPQEQLGKANDAKRKNDLQQVQKTIEIYYQDNQRYPEVSEVVWGTSLDTYGSLPKDPKANKSYAYVVSNNGQSYKLFAALDRGLKDPQAKTVCDLNGQNACAGFASCGQNIACNFGIASPNISLTAPMQ